MDHYNYGNFLEDLRAGREIHFIYKEENYYIGCGTGQFMFWRFYDSTSEMIGKDLDDLLRQVQLDGMQIKQVWDCIHIDMIF
ncbi:hypothetical protein [Lysinibacillus sp. 38-6]|uniref:hypothetical protein n=1 Tax=Lysinibacillus sp. 38-6 TaxID=3385991 RepID=UPI003908AB13